VILDNAKFNKLTPLLHAHIAKGDKILIFSQYVIQLDVLEAYLDIIGIKYTRLDGQTDVLDRQDLINEFNASDDTPVFLLSTKAGGVGLNLASANVVVIYDMDYNPHNDLQGIFYAMEGII